MAARGGRQDHTHACPTHPPTHSPIATHLPTYQGTRASCTRAACKLRAHAHTKAKRKLNAKSTVMNAKQKAKTKPNAMTTATSTATATAAGNQQPAAKSRCPPAVSCWSLAACHCPPSWRRRCPLSFHQCSSIASALVGEKNNLPFVISSLLFYRLRPGRARKIICTIEKYASNSCGNDLSQLKNMRRTHVKTYRLELQI